MVFVMAQNEPTMVLILSEADIGELRRGNTKFVDHRHTGHRMFNRVVVSLTKTDAEAIALVKSTGQTGYRDDTKLDATILPGEVRCPGCSAIQKSVGLLFENLCIVCWANRAKKAEISSN